MPAVHRARRDLKTSGGSGSPNASAVAPANPHASTPLAAAGLPAKPASCLELVEAVLKIAKPTLKVTNSATHGPFELVKVSSQLGITVKSSGKPLTIIFQNGFDHKDDPDQGKLLTVLLPVTYSTPKGLFYRQMSIELRKGGPSFLSSDGSPLVKDSVCAWPVKTGQDTGTALAHLSTFCAEFLAVEVKAPEVTKTPKSANPARPAKA